MGLATLPPFLQLLMLALLGGFPLSIAATRALVRWKFRKQGVVEGLRFALVEALIISAAGVPFILVFLGVRVVLGWTVNDCDAEPLLEFFLGFLLFVPAYVEASVLVAAIVMLEVGQL